MEFNHPELKPDFEYHFNSIPERDREYAGCQISVKDVLCAHYHIVDYFYHSKESEKRVGGIGPKDINMLCSAVARQCWSEDSFEICASLLYGLIQNHPFHDCNKRTAILTAFFYLRTMNRIPSVAHAAFEKLTVNIARNKLVNYKEYKKYLKKENGEIKVIATFLKRKTRAIEYDKPTITYNELNSILHANAISLETPSKGYIDVIKIEKVKKYGFIGSTKTTKRRLGRMIFRGWSRDVEPAGLDRVRKMTGLTLDQGFDSKTFFRGAESLPNLIEEYSEMLKRLADQ
ncbi:MAG: type II toxin-antitoxin system death-on-curing family toxin [Desulfovibrio sp.]|uniref:type II toxin-antitoxin system death-on-curing family toxin n=1 Tax=Desulfovibrio sp. 7SRBS1 TaxID=3378064 RepID=UPI003B3DBB2A